MTTVECISIIVTAMLVVWFIQGCNDVIIEERVIYENRDPVQKAKVRQWTDSFKGTTYTDTNGEWSMLVPPDTVINLCIENPLNNNIESCYADYCLLTPSLDGDNKMEKLCL